MKKIYTLLAVLFIGASAMKAQVFNFSTAITSSLLVGGYTVQSTVTGTQPGATSYSWVASSSTPSCAATQTVSASSLPSGTVCNFGFPCCIDYTVTCYAYNGSSAVGTPVSKVVSCSFNTSLAEYSSANIKLYPNPAHSYFTMEGDLENAEVKVFDLLGRSINLPLQHSSGSITVSTRTLNAGVYYVRINKGREESVHKVVVE